MFFAGKVDINTAELIGLGEAESNGEKIIQIVGMSFKENPKDGLRVQLLILNTFHKATDSQTLDKTLVCEKMHQSLFVVLIDTPDLTDQCSWTLLCNVHCFQCKQFELFYY